MAVLACRADRRAAAAPEPPGSDHHRCAACHRAAPAAVDRARARPEGRLPGRRGRRLVFAGGQRTTGQRRGSDWPAPAGARSECTQSLANDLPLHTPALIAAAPTGDWLVLEAVRPLRRADRWRAEDYWKAVRGLAALHERFWGLRDDLDAFPWLGRPLEADFAVHVAAAAQAIERIVTSGRPEALASRPERIAILAQLHGAGGSDRAPAARAPGDAPAR